MSHLSSFENLADATLRFQKSHLKEGGLKKNSKKNEWISFLVTSFLWASLLWIGFGVSPTHAQSANFGVVHFGYVGPKPPSEEVTPPSSQTSNAQTPTQAPQFTTQVTHGSQFAQNPAYYIQGNRPCWDAAAAYHHVDPWLLYAIAYVESRFNNRAIGKNTNGSVDLGLMQINSIWYPTLRKQGIPLSALNNACASTYIGAWILSKNIKTYGYTWRAIGAYNSAKPEKAYAYAKKVYEAHRILVATHNPAALASLYASSPVPLGMYRNTMAIR